MIDNLAMTFASTACENRVSLSSQSRIPGVIYVSFDCTERCLEPLTRDTSVSALISSEDVIFPLRYVSTESASNPACVRNASEDKKDPEQVS